MSRYDGKNWNGYFDHDSGLASNFINFLRAVGPVVYICTDKGLSTFNSETWITYKKTDNSLDGKAIVTTGKNVKEVPQSPSISHNFIIGVDANDDVIWVATDKGVSRGERMK
jgi:ligand-binding sensor domain-containing protein